MTIFRWRYVVPWFSPIGIPAPWPVSAILDMLGCEVQHDLDWDWPA